MFGKNCHAKGVGIVCDNSFHVNDINGYDGLFRDYIKNKHLEDENYEKKNKYCT